MPLRKAHPLSSAHARLGPDETETRMSHANAELFELRSLRDVNQTMESTGSSSSRPPHYILISQSSLPSSSSGPNVVPSAALIFPRIHYHYADDPPLALLPQPSSSDIPDGPAYLVLDWDPISTGLSATASPNTKLNLAHAQIPEMRSVSAGTAVVGIKASPAPGISDAVDHDRNTNMYVLETVRHLGAGGSNRALAG